MYRPNRLKARLAKGSNAMGCFSTFNSPLVTELMALAGFDFVIIDQEHGLGDPCDLVAHLQATSASAATSIVRVPSDDPNYLKRVLDDGVEGVMIPNVETAEQARAVVEACRYPTLGRRGVSGFARASNYGIELSDYFATAGDNLMIMCMIESATAVENIDEIAAVEGVDAFFIGPRDLSATIGVANQFDHPKLQELIDRAADAIRRNGKVLASVPYSKYTWSDMFERGFQIVAVGSDVTRIRDSSLRDVAKHRAANG